MAQETHYLNASQMVKGEVGESNKAPKLNGLVEPKEPRKEAKSGRYKVADNSNLSQKEMANRMKVKACSLIHLVQGNTGMTS